MEKSNTEQEFIIAFWKLYEIKPIEKISVSSLCKTAGYNRATFYNHFDNIYDLLNKAICHILYPIKCDLFPIQDYNTYFYNILFTHFHKQNKYIKLLFERKNHYVLGKQIKKELLLHISESMKDPSENSERLEILLEYQISAVLGVIDYWYQQGKNISEQDILQRIYEISEIGVLNALKYEFECVMK